MEWKCNKTEREREREKENVKWQWTDALHILSYKDLNMVIFWEVQDWMILNN
jgi:hypothetical protein